MKRSFDDLLFSLYESLRYSLKDIAIFPGSNLLGVLKYAVIVSIISTVTHFFELSITFLDWRGAWLGTTVLLVIYLLTFREESESDGTDNNDGIPSSSEESIEVSSSRASNET